MRSIAERLVAGLPAAAKLDGCPSGKSEGRPGGIANFKISVDLDWTVVETRDLGRWHSYG